MERDSQINVGTKLVLGESCCWVPSEALTENIYCLLVGKRSVDDAPFSFLQATRDIGSNGSLTNAVASVMLYCFSVDCCCRKLSILATIIDLINLDRSDIAQEEKSNIQLFAHKVIQEVRDCLGGYNFVADPTLSCA